MNLIFFIVIAILSVPSFIPNSGIIGSLSIGDILFTIISPIIIIKFNYKIIFNKVNISLLIVGIISLISSINSYLNLQFTDLNITNILYSFKWFYFALMTSIMTGLSLNSRILKLLINAILAGCLLTLFITIYIWFQYPVFAPLSRIPMLHIVYEEGFKINRNYLGYVLSIGASISYGMLFVESKLKRKIYYSIISLILFLALILTFSKGSWLCILSLILVSLFRDIKKFRTYIVIFSLFITSFFLTRINLFEVILRRLNNSYNSMRFQFIKESIDLTLNHPILGVGPQAYKSAAIENNLLPTDDPHNIYTWISSELGLISFILICFILVQFVQNIYFINRFKLEPLNIPLINLSVVFFVHSFLSGLTISSRYFWLILGISQGIIIYQKNILKKTNFNFIE